MTDEIELDATQVAPLFPQRCASCDGTRAYDSTLAAIAPAVEMLFDHHDVSLQAANWVRRAVGDGWELAISVSGIS